MQWKKWNNVWKEEDIMKWREMKWYNNEIMKEENVNGWKWKKEEKMEN